MQPGLQDAADNREIEFAGAQQQPGEQIEAGVPAEVAHGGGIALAHLDQAGAPIRVECLTHGWAGHAEHLGEASLAGQRLPGLHLAAEHVGNDLLEYIFGYRTTVHRLQGHVPRMADQR